MTVGPAVASVRDRRNERTKRVVSRVAVSELRERTSAWDTVALRVGCSPSLVQVRTCRMPVAIAVSTLEDE
jgi:hypothetical protein